MVVGGGVCVLGGDVCWPAAGWCGWCWVVCAVVCALGAVCARWCDCVCRVWWCVLALLGDVCAGVMCAGCGGVCWVVVCVLGGVCAGWWCV